ncbi:hypothetical protein FZEAL_5756 [Fusarium zealandicum]|uniref:Uncharacterized protein n=1 Tax=Fusarium zealandicum TaxID=1053134 RepID=A0A8H4XK70_9HYPO|nr:hypothetical protein FZEAL_5756 [Fusarium zealandicum]
MSRSPVLFNCLIRTHHITSRKKLQRVRRAAQQLNVDWLLVRSGGSPGIMFAEGRDETGLTDWVATVQALRYKDFREEEREHGHGGIATGPSNGDRPALRCESKDQMHTPTRQAADLRHRVSRPRPREPPTLGPSTLVHPYAGRLIWNGCQRGERTGNPLSRSSRSRLLGIAFGPWHDDKDHIVEIKPG